MHIAPEAVDERWHSEGRDALTSFLQRTNAPFLGEQSSLFICEYV